MTLQTLFDRMMLYDNQLDLIAGGDDVARGLTATNLVQDWYELEAGRVADIHQTINTFTTTANVEFTTWPTNLLRADNFYLLDSNGNQLRELDPVDTIGGHRPGYPWPMVDMETATVLPGAPWEFYGTQQGGLIFWNPTPNAVHTIRAYGLWAVADYTAAANTFLYPDSVALALVPHAVEIIRVGLERDFSAHQSAARLAFRDLIKTFMKAIHVAAQSRTYAEIHET